MTYFVYILKCSDGSYYTGKTKDLSRRVREHQIGADHKAYTYSRRLVELMWSQEFATEREAFQFERQIKGWNRCKKSALIRGDWDGIRKNVQRQKIKLRL